MNDLDTIVGVHNITGDIYAEAKACVPNMDWIIFYQPQPKVVETYGTSLLNLSHLDHDQMRKCLSRGNYGKGGWTIPG